jgi:GT2 family glycosyltransferase
VSSLLHAKVAISIVTYNSQHIFKVLDHLIQEFSNDSRFRFVLFDNDSNNDYIERLKEYQEFADITFYHENKGFGFGHNYNLLKANEEYFLVFNPDVILVKEDLLKMLGVIEKDKSIALLVPKVLNSDGTTQHLMRDRVSVFDYALRFIPFKFVKDIFHKRLASYELRDISNDRLVDIRIGSGCFMLLRGNDFKRVKGFDDRYFMYFEDYDLCLKLRNNHGRIVYTPFSKVVHYYERGAHKNPTLFKIFIQSMFKYFNKWGWKFF